MKKAADPIAQLMQEHNEALTHLKQLGRAVQSLSQDGYSAKTSRQVMEVLRFIELEVKVHNRSEEVALFPVLERYVEGPTRVMVEDHRKLRRGFAQLNSAFAKVVENHDSFSAIRRFNTVAKEVIQLFVNHIHKENYILFPLVQRFLRKEELREIARKML